MKSDTSRHSKLLTALLGYTNLSTVPTKERTHTSKFAKLAMKTGDERVDDKTVEAAFALAVEELRDLIDQGRLPGFELPGFSASSTDSGTMDGAESASEGVPVPSPTRVEPKYPIFEREIHTQVIQRASTPEPDPAVQVHPETPNAQMVPIADIERGEGVDTVQIEHEAANDEAADASDEANWTPLPAHPLAAIFPMMSDDQLQSHADDIKVNGQQVPILIFEGQVLDGRNTQAACKLTGVMPRYEEWTGQGSPVSVVLSRNAHRRQLTDAQRAVSAARAKVAFEEEARQRRDANLLQNKGSTDGLDPGHRSEGRSAELAAKALRVSRDAVNKAVKVTKEGVSELVVAVEQGAVSLDAGALLATLPTEEQRETLVGGPKKVQQRVKEMRDAAKTAKRQRRNKDSGSSEKPADTSDTENAKPATHDDTNTETANDTKPAEQDTSTTATETANTQPTDTPTTNAPPDDTSSTGTAGTTSSTTTTPTDATTEHLDAGSSMTTSPATTTATTAGSTTAPATTAENTTTDAGAADDSSEDGEDEDEQVAVTYDQARQVVWAALQANRDLAERELIDLANQVGIDVMMLSSDRMRNVNSLWNRMTDELNELGRKRPDTARDWLDGTIQQAEELRSGFEHDVDESGIAPRRSSGPVPELDD